MLELETSVLSKSALKPQSASHDQSPALVSGSNCAGSANAHDSPHVSASADESVFFRVFEVAEGGPAQAAGLTDGDTVRLLLWLCHVQRYFDKLIAGSISVQRIGAHHASHSFGAASCISGSCGKRWWMHVLACRQVIALSFDLSTDPLFCLRCYMCHVFVFKRFEGRAGI